MKTISRIFYIYSNAWAAAALAIGALLELFCALGLFYFGSIVLAWFALGSFAVLGSMALGLAFSVYIDAKSKGLS